ncbi:MAG: glutathione S-transferase family protein [Sphingomonas sp.]|uniref:glutathione S-transferase family protein n=1 Tax=Sphingomonas sp. TaxID=28214 RepID=UPI001AC5B1CC|nr:glutathione S-transferase family protein [Sphingomonas sp.]MBN8807149.1 glutathione S-transferase family protein [Sphingomonas sp.]
MLFYNAPNPAPTPRRVRIFLAEKGIAVPMQDISIMGGELKSDAFLAVNPLGQVPALKLDSGEVLTETVSICRYFEALHPTPPMFGTDPLEMARIDMWIRRVELRFGSPLAMIWVHTHALTARLFQQFTEFGESNRPKVADAMRFIDDQLAGREYLASDAFSMADICLLTIVDFAGFVGTAVPDELTNLTAWHARVSARPSARA